MPETRRKYTREFKIDAVHLLESSSKSGREIEKDLGIGSGMIYRWKKEFGSKTSGHFQATGILGMKSCTVFARSWLR